MKTNQTQTQSQSQSQSQSQLPTRRSDLQVGDYLKAVGANWGRYWDGRRWVTFECVGCAYALGLLNRRLQNNDFPRMKWNNLKYDVKHDRELHNQWLNAGKPLGGIK